LEENNLSVLDVQLNFFMALVNRQFSFLLPPTTENFSFNHVGLLWMSRDQIGLNATDDTRFATIL
jgi:hypothetical protein